jgi:hypothetical protein
VKRLLVLTTILGLSLFVPQSIRAIPTVHAAGAVHGHGYGSKAKPANGPGVSTIRRHVPEMVSRQTSVSGSILLPLQLELPASAFPPGSYLYEEHEETASQADDSRFGSLHVSTYANLGMQGGWFQYYTTQIPDGLFDVAYLGTYYPSSSDASRAFNDVRTNPVFANGTACAYGDQCYQDYIVAVFSDGEYRGMLQVVQSSNALMEVISLVPAADLSSRQSEILANVNRVSAAFVQVATPPALTAVPTATRVPSTIAPTSTATSPPTATSTSPPTATATATSTPTSTPIPLFVTVHLAHKSVGSGKKQTVSATTLASAAVIVVVTFPDGAKMRHTGAADADGRYAWSFKQPAGHTKAAKRTAGVLVTATHGSDGPVRANASYTIR